MHEASHCAALIELDHVCKYYADGDVHALRDITFRVLPGESISIVGPSGCGKSTLLNIVGALDRPTSGEVLFRGKSIQSTDLNSLRSQEFGFVFQSFYLLPNLTALENVQLPMFEGSKSLGQRIEKAKQLLAQVGLEQRLNHLPNQLSIGQRQRVAIARALANDPAIILADEPTGSLDSTSGAEVMDLLLALNAQQSTTLIIVTHDLSLAALTKRMLRMKDGAIVDDAHK
ncbi:MAG: ABC transporter ATP-binding protein [Pirellulales bacterium]